MPESGSRHVIPDRPASTFGEYAEEWVARREISGHTRESYRRLLQARLIPTFADTKLGEISPEAVAHWYARTAIGTPTVRNHAYSLLRSILEAALADQLIDTNPCQIDGVSTSHRAEKCSPATAAEVAAVANAMPAPYRTLVLMVAWLGMPLSELRELRRKDIDLAANVVRVRRAVQLVDGTVEVTTPTAKPGIRDIPIPPSLLSPLQGHLQTHVQPGGESLLFPSFRDPDRHVSQALLYRVFKKASEAIGRPDLRIPDLRRSPTALAHSQSRSLR